MTNQSDSSPLVSFLVFAYQQENYIREAIEGAFAQTYSSMEIILSDDCSTDNTFQIMSDMAASYQGPHTIRLNRNAKNLNIGGHLVRCMHLAQGDFLVIAAGDDISLPDRTSEIADPILHNPLAKAVFSDCQYIEQCGASINSHARIVEKLKSARH